MFKSGQAKSSSVLGVSPKESGKKERQRHYRGKRSRNKIYILFLPSTMLVIMNKAQLNVIPS